MGTLPSLGCKAHQRETCHLQLDSSAPESLRKDNISGVADLDTPKPHVFPMTGRGIDAQR